MSRRNKEKGPEQLELEGLPEADQSLKELRAERVDAAGAAVKRFAGFGGKLLRGVARLTRKTAREGVGWAAITPELAQAGSKKGDEALRGGSSRAEDWANQKSEDLFQWKDETSEQVRQWATSKVESVKAKGREARDGYRNWRQTIKDNREKARQLAERRELVKAEELLSAEVQVDTKRIEALQAGREAKRGRLEAIQGRLSELRALAGLEADLSAEFAGGE